MWRRIALLAAGAVLTGIGLFLWAGASNPRAPAPDTAPGSAREGEPVSPHFVSVLERLSYDTFKVTVRPVTPVDPKVELYPGLTMIKLLVLDKKGRAIPDLPEHAVVRISVSSGPPDSDGLLRRASRTFRIDPAKLPEGTYIISARVEACEEGENAVFSKSNFSGSMTTTVRNSYEFVVPAEFERR